MAKDVSAKNNKFFFFNICITVQKINGIATTDRNLLLCPNAVNAINCGRNVTATAANRQAKRFAFRERNKRYVNNPKNR